MPFVPAPNIVMVEIRAIMDSQHIENRIMVDVLTEPTPTICSDLAALVGGWVGTSYVNTVTADVTFTEVVATSQHSIDGPQATFSAFADAVGNVAGQAMPNETSLCLSLRTGNRGRSARGRLYMFGIPRSVVNLNTADATYLSGVVGLFETLMSDINGLGWLWVIVSYVSEGAPRPGGPVYFPITEMLFTDPTVDSQQRRKPGVGS